jgi:hypothetical protein
MHNCRIETGQEVLPVTIQSLTNHAQSNSCLLLDSLQYRRLASDSKKAFTRAASWRHSGRIEASCPLTAEDCSSVASLALGGMSFSVDNAIHVGIGLGGKL